MCTCLGFSPCPQAHPMMRLPEARELSLVAAGEDLEELGVKGFWGECTVLRGGPPTSDSFTWALWQQSWPFTSYSVLSVLENH